MLIREVPIFVLSHKNSRVLERGGGGGREGSRRGGGVSEKGARRGWGGGRWCEGNRGCIKYAWKSKKISLQIIGVVTEGLKQHCLP